MLAKNIFLVYKDSIPYQFLNLFAHKVYVVRKKVLFEICSVLLATKPTSSDFFPILIVSNQVLNLGVGAFVPQDKCPNMFDQLYYFGWSW